MIRKLTLIGVAVFFGVTIGLLPSANAGPFRTVQQTKEPPLYGQPLPQPPKMPAQLTPVPVVPAPYLPPQFLPAPTLPPTYAPTPVLPPTYNPPPYLPSPFAPPPYLPPFPPGAVEVPCPPVDPPAPQVKIQVRVAECSGAGQEIEYSIRIENCSPADAHHVVVRNPMPGNCRFVRAKPEPASKGEELVWSFGTLKCGDCREIVLVLAPTDTADVKNCARVQFEHGQCVITRIAKAAPGVIESPKGAETPKGGQPPKVIETPKTIPGTAKLSLKITGPKLQYANLPAKYQITVTNTGDKAAENLLVTAFLPEKAAFLSASDEGRFHFSQVAWLLGSLPAGASKTVQLTYKASVGGEFCLKASGLADTDVHIEAELCTTFAGVSALLLETVDTKDPVEVGGQTSYRISIKNQGSANLSNVQIQVMIPPQMSLVKANGPTTPPKQENLPPATAEGQLLSFAPLKELPAGESQIYEIFVNAVKAGDARWKTVLTADQLTGGPVTEQESTNVFREDEVLRPPQPALPAARGRIALGPVH